MARNDRDTNGAGGERPSCRLARRNPTHHGVGPLVRSAPRQTAGKNYREIEDAVNGIKWTEHDRRILHSWKRALVDIWWRHQFLEESDVARARRWCQVNPQEREEIAALVVELIRSDEEVQRALVEWACGSPYVPIEL